MSSNNSKNEVYFKFSKQIVYECRKNNYSFNYCIKLIAV